MTTPVLSYQKSRAAREEKEREKGGEQKAWKHKERLIQSVR